MLELWEASWPFDFVFAGSNLDVFRPSLWSLCFAWRFTHGCSSFIWFFPICCSSSSPSHLHPSLPPLLSRWIPLRSFGSTVTTKSAVTSWGRSDYEVCKTHLQLSCLPLGLLGCALSTILVTLTTEMCLWHKLVKSVQHQSTNQTKSSLLIYSGITYLNLACLDFVLSNQDPPADCVVCVLLSKYLNSVVIVIWVLIFWRKKKKK